MSDSLLQILLSNIMRFAFAAVCVLGLIFAIVRRSTLGRAATPAIFGAALSLFSSLLGAVIWPLLPRLMSASGSSSNFIFSAVSIVLGLISTAGMALLVLAIFIDRPKAGG